MQETQTAIRKRTITPVISFIVRSYTAVDELITTEEWTGSIPDVLYDAWQLIDKDWLVASVLVTAVHGSFHFRVSQDIPKVQA